MKDKGHTTYVAFYFVYSLQEGINVKYDDSTGVNQAIRAYYRLLPGHTRGKDK